MDPSLPQDEHARMQQHQQQQQYFGSSFTQEPMFTPQMSPYHVPHPPRQLSVNDLQQQQTQAMHHQYHQTMPDPFSNHSYQPNGVYSSSPPHGLSITATPPPPSPTDAYDPPLSPPISGSDTSADGFYHHPNLSSSSANSVGSSRSNSLVHRSVRYNPSPSPTSSAGRPYHHRRGFSNDSDDDEMRHVDLAHTRKEATRKQRIEAEQKRRDELRDGYAKLKDVLPISNQKSSKVNLLERATNRIIQLEKEHQELQARITALHEEVARLQSLNEKISLGGSVGTPSPGRFNIRPLSPPPEPHGHHASGAHRIHDSPSDASTPSASENGY